ncbi:hypothetical protein Vafri_20460 [Volvox africanus]|uniref:Uncharacterized protein n=1 Tax=Volvox africanus TaxID=51714 RepID=A0A8J4BWW0_9CHLO|nr:hypothetical protein Vafri_20460 [Volvox africanus]
MAQPCYSREISSASDVEETSKAPSLQGDGSSSPTDDEGWPAFTSRSRCRRPKWTKEEEMVLVEAHCTLGNAWVAIAECLPGRTPSEVKNIWHSTLRARKLQTRSVLRAYVTALKDRADKPAARQQAMRAAQHFVSEGNGNKLPSPAKRVPKRPSMQQQQPPHQSRTKTITVTCQRLQPVAAVPQQGSLAPEGGLQVAPAYSGRESAVGSAAPVPPTPATIGGAAAAAATAPSAVAATTAVATVGAPPATATATAVALPATAHRSSLGSDWSSVTSGAVEVWRPAAAATGGASSAPGPQPASAVGAGAPRRLMATTCGAEFAVTAAPAVTLAFSPASSPYALPPAADRRASTGAFVTTGTTNDGRFSSPILSSNSPRPEVNLLSAGPGTAPVGGGGGGSGNLGSSNCWRDSTAGCVCVGYIGDGGTVAPNPAAAAAAASGLSEPLKPVDGTSEMQIDGSEALWQCSSGHGSSFNTRAATATSWEMGSFAQPPRGVYVVSTGGGVAGGVGTCGTWTETGGRGPLAIMSNLQQPGPSGAVMRSTPASARPSAGSPLPGNNCALAAKALMAPITTTCAAANIAAQHARGAGGSSAVASPSPFGGGRGGVVTLGFGGITDEELLACIGA